MLYFENWKIALICAVCALGVLLSLPNLFGPSFLAQMPNWLPHKQVALGLDLRGGSYLLLEVDVAAAQRERLNSITDNVRNSLREANIGYTGLSVEGDAIVFTIREPGQIEAARQALRKIDPDLTVDITPDGSGTMRFSTVATEARRRQAVEQSIEIIRRRIDETGTNEPTVSFRFDAAGAKRFGDATRDNVGKHFAIVLDNKVISAPVIREPILGGSGIISGSFTVQSASDLALLLRAGALPAPITILEERTVGAELGADSIHAGAVASIVGVALVIVFMVLFYGLFGVFADIALMFNLCLMLGALSLLGATLTLPGIAGIALTMGMSVDANVLIYERIREA